MNHHETLNQLVGVETNGIGILAAMTGAKNFGTYEDSIQFRFPAMKHGERFNFCKITLNGDDTYTMRLSKIVKHVETKINECPGLYNDMLKAHFETTTGLSINLKR